MLISSRPRNFDVSYSRSLSETGKISIEYFWEAVNFIVDEMIKHELWFFDVFHLGNNVLVKKLSASKYIPVIIDCKRSGWSSFPLQFNLLLRKEREKKLCRRYDIKAFKTKEIQYF